MGIFNTAYEKLSALTGKSFKDSEMIIKSEFMRFCSTNDFDPYSIFLLIVQEKIHIVVLSDILGPKIGFVLSEDIEQVLS